MDNTGSVLDFMKSRDSVYTVVPTDITGGLMIQSAIEPGLARVFTHILEFDNNEFYFAEWPSLVRRKFADICFMFEEAVPFGLKLATPAVSAESGRLVHFLINPPGDQVIEDGDLVI